MDRARPTQPATAVDARSMEDLWCHRGAGAPGGPARGGLRASVCSVGSMPSGGSAAASNSGLIARRGARARWRVAESGLPTPGGVPGNAASEHMAVVLGARVHIEARRPMRPRSGPHGRRSRTCAGQGSRSVAATFVGGLGCGLPLYRQATISGRQQHCLANLDTPPVAPAVMVGARTRQERIMYISAPWLWGRSQHIRFLDSVMSSGRGSSRAMLRHTTCDCVKATGSSTERSSLFLCPLPSGQDAAWAGGEARAMWDGGRRHFCRPPRCSCGGSVGLQWLLQACSRGRSGGSGPGLGVPSTARGPWTAFRSGGARRR